MYVHHITLLNAIPYEKPGHWQLSTTDPSGHFHYSYDCIYQLKVEYFVIEIHHGDILYFSFLCKQQKVAFQQYTVLQRKKLNFGLCVCRIFPVCGRFVQQTTPPNQPSWLHYFLVYLTKFSQASFFNPLTLVQHYHLSFLFLISKKDIWWERW